MARNGFRDPAFMENRSAPIHRWVPWIAGFSTQFVEDVFKTFVQANGRRPVVLDPFAGVGTTLVQAMLHGYDAIGYELNPYAALATKAKLAAARIDVDYLVSVLLKVKLAARSRNGAMRRPPSGFRSRIPFFSPQVEGQVLRLLDVIDSIPEETAKNLGRVAFGSVMVSVSNYTYEPSLSSRPGAQKPLIESADVAEVFLRKVQEMVDDVAWLQENIPPQSGQRYEVHCADFLEAGAKAPANHVDLVVTSPPYMNNYHYVRNTRPQLFWLSLISSPDELRRLERANFGKSWQAVRQSEPLLLECNHVELQETVERLRKVRVEAEAYGGPGWANYVVSYFNDCQRFLRALKRVLRRRAVAVIVIGNSIIQGVPIETDRILGELAEADGMVFEETIPLRTKRVGASITASAVRRGESRVLLYENAVVLRKR